MSNNEAKVFVKDDRQTIFKRKSVELEFFTREIVSFIKDKKYIVFLESYPCRR